jgi:hypothetical protein
MVGDIVKWRPASFRLLPIEEHPSISRPEQVPGRNVAMDESGRRMRLEPSASEESTESERGVR